MFGYAIDLQAGVPRSWTMIGTVLLVVGTLRLYHGVSASPLAVPAVYTGLLVALAVPILALGVYWTPLVRWAAAAFGGGNAS